MGGSENYYEKDALGVHPNSMQAKINRKEVPAEVRRRFFANRQRFNGDQAAQVAWERAGFMSGLPSYDTSDVKEESE